MNPNRPSALTYAPLNSDGPLPPGVSADFVADAYRSAGVPLKIFIKKSTTETQPAAALRRALDDARWRSTSHTPFHNIIYRYLQKQSKTLYNELIAPVERKLGDRVFLDVERFASRVASRYPSQAEPSATEELETLAHFALAFGLLQPHDARRLVDALVNAHPWFAAYFGVGETQAVEDAVVEADPGIFAEESEAPEMMEVPSTIESEAVVEDAHRAEPAPSTFMQTKLASAEAELASMRSLRQRLGSAPTVGDALVDAIRKEVAAGTSLEVVVQEICHARDERWRAFDSAASAARLTLARNHFPLTTADAARWVDNTEALSERVFTLSGALAERYDKCRELGLATTVNSEATSVLVPTIEEIVPTITMCIEELDARIGRATERRRVITTTLEFLADRRALDSGASDWIHDVGIAAAHALLTEAPNDPKYRRVECPLWRLIAEREHWDQEEITADSAALLRQTFLPCTTAKEIADRLRFLTLPMLQQLIAGSDPVIGRAVMLATFAETLLAQQDLFFVPIWSLDRCPDRLSLTGDAVIRFFNAARQVCLTQGIDAVVSELERLFSSGPAGATAGSVLADLESAESLIQQLENAGNVTGHFLRLRTLAISEHIRPLIVLIQNEKLVEARRVVARLQAELENDELVDAVVAEYEDRIELRADHSTSVRRMMEHHLDLAEKWLERQSSQRPTGAAIGSAPTELATAAKRILGRSSSAPALETAEGFESGVAHVLRAFANAPRTRSGLVFGELPPPREVLEASPERIWPPWLLVAPAFRSAWIALSHHRPLSWTDVVRDQIEHHLLSPLSPLEILQSFVDAREYEAVTLSADAAGFESPECLAIIERANGLAARRTCCEVRADEIDRSLGALERTPLGSDQRDRLDMLRQRLIEVLTELDEDIDRAEQLLETAAAESVLLIERINSDAAERHRRFTAAYEWLSEANETLSRDTTLDAAEKRVEAISAASAARRQHVDSLRRLAAEPVPNMLARAVSSCLKQCDRPAQWPMAERSLQTATYIDYFSELSSGWWAILPVLSEGDQTYDRIISVVAVLAAHLEKEVVALCTGDVADAIVLPALYARGDERPATCYAVLVSLGLIDTIAGDLVVDERSAEDIIDPGTVLSGGAVQRAYEAFQEGVFENVLAPAAAAYRWANANGHPDAGPLLAMYTWARVRTKAVSVDAELDAIANLVRHHERILSRARKLDRNRIAQWLIEAVEQTREHAVDPVQSLASLLMRICDSPGEERDRFATVMRAGDAAVMSEYLWQIVTNRSAATRARTALLILLFELGERPALHHLFNKVGEASKYLFAFTAISSRVRSEPSANLYSALAQNVHRLRDLKEKAFRDFAEAISKRVQYVPSRIEIKASDTLDLDHDTGAYKLLLTITPDQADPPLSLLLEIVSTPDVGPADGAAATMQVVRDALLFEAVEVELVLKSRIRQGSAVVALRVVAETASGRTFDYVERLELPITANEPRFHPLPLDEILECYDGCQGKPVTGAAFLGRENELAIIERAVGRSSQGAVVLYGSRRLGKTSLLQVAQLRFCATNSARSRTLFLTVAVDTFPLYDISRPFLSRFLNLLHTAVVSDPANEGFRAFLRRKGVSKHQLQQCAPPVDAATPFLAQLRTYLAGLRELSGGRFDQVTLVLDEFDKLLEAYRSEFRAHVNDLMNQLRKAATEEQGIGVILAGSDLMRLVVGEYRSAMHGSAAEVQLQRFTCEEHYNVLRAIVAPPRIGDRLVFSEEVTNTIASLAGGHPFYTRVAACATAVITQRRRITHGTVVEAIHRLLRNEVLAGEIPYMRNVVEQQLQVLNALSAEARSMARILLYKLAQRTSLEQLRCTWVSVVRDERLLAIRPLDAWNRVSRDLLQAQLISRDNLGMYGFTIPILGEDLRVDGDDQLEWLMAELVSER